MALGLPVVAQESPQIEGASARGATDASITNRKDARTITLAIPAPRGLITDRFGEPLAQSKVAYQLAIQFSQFENAERSYVVEWGRRRLEAAKKLVPGIVDKTDDELYDHYRNRRWLPLLISNPVDEKAAEQLQSKLTAGLLLHPIYIRSYPETGVAAHVIGYTGSIGKLPTGPINFNEPLWEESEGRAGLEKIFNTQLTGEAGTKRLLFDENGNKLLEEQTKRPRPGGTLVTTINLKWQRAAEKALKDGCQRGAFVVIDVTTGEVLVMASRPTFDLNAFIPGISELDYKKLQEDPGRPLFARAYQGEYPPGSTFKPVVALTALNNGIVTEKSLLDCPAAIAVGNHVFNNWTKVPEGPIDVKRAIARSCNTWFYQIGLKLGWSAYLGMAKRLGYGSTTGLPLIGERPGLIPDNDWMRKHEKRPIMGGDTAQMAIGQGVVLATPLQIAQAMAGIANGGALPKLHLIRQGQDGFGRVMTAAFPERRAPLAVDPHAVEVVREGMRDVVSSSYGTAKRAAVGYAEICGKTGTSQWGPPSKNQRLAWFGGFMPFDNPRYAFAVLYEGKPGETVSGGRMAAPMVKQFFEELEGDVKDEIAPPPKAEEISPDEQGVPTTEDGVLKAIPVDPSELDQPVVPDAPAAGGDEAAPPLRALPVREGEEGAATPPRGASGGGNTNMPRRPQEPLRAQPVTEDEDPSEGVEETVPPRGTNGGAVRRVQEQPDPPREGILRGADSGRPLRVQEQPGEEP